jgi:acetyl esterase/lipase
MEEISLWPEGAPDPLPRVGREARFRQVAGGGPEADWLRNVTAPSLTVVPAAAGIANGAGVIICPGGGWRILAWDHEGLDIARWFAARGVTAFVLKYRLMGTPDDPAEFTRFNAVAQGREADLGRVAGREAPRSLAALVGANAALAQARAAAAADGRQALSLVMAQADRFSLASGRIGMIGFSAGAFRATDVALAPGAGRLAFLAAIYGGETGGVPVPPDAPPLFACIAQDDRMLFRVVEGLYADWCDADRPAELHMFQRGGHGFGMVAQNAPVDQWTSLLEAWLKDLAILTG